MPFAAGSQLREFALDDPGLQPPADALGERYVLDQLIGEGAFARTYRGRDTRLARTVAVKLLRSYYAADPAFLERFQREAQAAARVDHPNVVQVYDYGGHEGAYYLVLQYIPGHDLGRLIAERAPLPPADAIRIAREILSGLAAIHAAGIIHRDIKPQNVLIGLDGIPRVTDFGIAYESGRGLTGLTSYGVTLGTPAYMAPEQANGEPVSQATDLYSASIVLFEMLTGRLPFNAESALAMMIAHVEQQPPPPSTIQPGVPPELDAVVLRGLAKLPGNRYAGAIPMERALLDALIAMRNSAPRTARLDVPLAGKVRAAPSPPAAVQTAPLPSIPPPGRRNDQGGADSHRRTEPHRDRRVAGWIVPTVIAMAALAVLLGALVRALDDGNSGGEGRPTRTTTTLELADETPEPTPTRRTINVPADPVRTSVPIEETDRDEDGEPVEERDPTEVPVPTEEPKPTDEPEPTETPELPTEEPVDEDDGGPPTIAPSNNNADLDVMIAVGLE